MTGKEEKSADAYISKDLFTKMINSEVIVFANDVEYVRKDVAVMIMENYANHKTEPLRDQLSKEAKMRKELVERVSAIKSELKRVQGSWSAQQVLDMIDRNLNT